MSSYFTIVSGDPEALTVLVNHRIAEEKKNHRDEPAVIAVFPFQKNGVQYFAAVLSMLVPNPTEVYAEDEEDEEEKEPEECPNCSGLAEDCGWCDTCDTSGCECEKCKDCEYHNCVCERCECCDEKLDCCECDKCQVCEKDLCEKASDLDDPLRCTCLSNLETTAISAG